MPEHDAARVTHCAGFRASQHRCGGGKLAVTNRSAFDNHIGQRRRPRLVGFNGADE